MKDIRERKCNNCNFYIEVTGSPGHGDYRCTNEKSTLYNRRIGEIERAEIPLLEKCGVRKGKMTAIVTGTSRGIGKAIVGELAYRRYDIALISRHFDDIKKVAKEIDSKAYLNGWFLPFECDVRDKKSVSETFRRIYEEFGSIDVLVNNAGINSRRTLSPNPETLLNNLEDNLAGWNEEIATNLTGTYICSYIASAYMLKKGRGSIINISSVKGKEPTSSPGYGASKAGVIKLTRDFAKALAPSIRVNCVAPGFIDTRMTSELPEEKKQAYKKMIPVGRFGTVEEIAKVVAFLASEDASYITGATIDINGGYLMS